MEVHQDTKADCIQAHYRKTRLEASYLLTTQYSAPLAPSVQLSGELHRHSIFQSITHMNGVSVELKQIFILVE